MTDNYRLTFSWYVSINELFFINRVMSGFLYITPILKVVIASFVQSESTSIPLLILTDPLVVVSPCSRSMYGTMLISYSPNTEALYVYCTLYTVSVATVELLSRRITATVYLVMLSPEIT